jgi:hypothetical protein
MTCGTARPREQMNEATDLGAGALLMRQYGRQVLIVALHGVPREAAKPASYQVSLISTHGPSLVGRWR